MWKIFQRLFDSIPKVDLNFTLLSPKHVIMGTNSQNKLSTPKNHPKIPSRELHTQHHTSKAKKTPHDSLHLKNRKTAATTTKKRKIFHCRYETSSTIQATEHNMNGYITSM